MLINFDHTRLLSFLGGAKTLNHCLHPCVPWLCLQPVLELQGSCIFALFGDSVIGKLTTDQHRFAFTLLKCVLVGQWQCLEGKQRSDI